MSDPADPSAPDARGFAAGTLVHTRDGLRPIEAVAIGDMVLSQSERGGERAYKRVVRVVLHEAAAIGQAYFWILRGEESINEHVLTTALQEVHVGAYQNDGVFSDEYWADMDKPIGWRPVEWLDSHQLVEVASGEMTRVGRFKRIWLTRNPGEGFIESNPDSNMGHNVQISGGQIVGERGPWIAADLTSDDFNLRNETPEEQEIWGYKLPVHDLEVEDFHTYYVGERGVWVRGASSTGHGE